MKHQYDFIGNGYNFVKIIQRILGSNFVRTQKESTVDFYDKTGRRILQLVDNPNTLEVRFDVPVPNLRKYEKLEKIHHHNELQHEHEWIYRGESIDDVIALIEIALVNFNKK